MFCHTCGRRGVDGAEFCHGCGTRLITDEQSRNDGLAGAGVDTVLPTTDFGTVRSQEVLPAPVPAVVAPTIPAHLRANAPYGASPSAAVVATVYADPPGAGFWAVWCAGAFLSLVAGILSVSSDGGAGTVWLLLIGIVLCLANIWFAVGTHGYSEGDGIGFGKNLALITGWGSIILTIALLVLTIIIVIIAVVVAVGFLIAIYS